MFIMRQKILKLIGRATTMMILSMLICTSAFAQKTIIGKIIGKDGQPVTGATVKVKGSTVATSTAADGSYTISVPNDQSVLTISSVGYAAVDILASNAREVSLTESANALTEVVVTSLGLKKRKKRWGML